jgi:hypothetical protein
MLVLETQESAPIVVMSVAVLVTAMGLDPTGKLYSCSVAAVCAREGTITESIAKSNSVATIVAGATVDFIHTPIGSFNV